MRLFCIGAVFCGAGILFYSIVQYIRSLLELQKETYEKRMLSKRIYGLSLGLMCFFLLGYLLLGVNFLLLPQIAGNDLLTACVFFFGSVFVLVMVWAQAKMNRSISKKTNEVLMTLVNAMEAKDPYTRGHSQHVYNLVELFYEALPDHIKARVDATRLLDAAMLHDIGKIGVPDRVLNKPVALDDGEWTMIREHPKIGCQIVSQTSFRLLGDIILYHHERMDGKGYYGVPPEKVPIEARMIAIADTFSALYSDRVYRPCKSFAEAMEIIKDAAGNQLDGELVRIFVGIPKESIDEQSENVYDFNEPCSGLKIAGAQ